jgi:hypothetical protein
VTNKDWLSPPLDDDILPLWNRTEVHLDLGEREDVRRGGQVGEEVGDDRLGSGGGDETHGADHEVGVGAGGGLGGTGGVLGVVGYGGGLGRLLGRRRHGTGLEGGRGEGCTSYVISMVVSRVCCGNEEAGLIARPWTGR